MSASGLGDAGMTLGLHMEPSAMEKQAIISAFASAKYRLTMDAWCKCHLAFILPVCYLSYALDCDLTRAESLQIKQVMEAVKEGYALLTAPGCPILPEDILGKLQEFKGWMSYAMLRLMAKTAIGRLAATDHCRHAVTEMEALDIAFAALREQKAGLSMANWGALRGAMPEWETLCRMYEKSAE